MNKKTGKTIAIAAGIGLVAYMLYKKSGAREIEAPEEAPEETGKGSETMPKQAEVDHVIDTESTGMPVTTAIRQAKQLATALQDANIIVKTPDGQPNISVTAGQKKPGLFARLKAAKAARRARRRKGKKAKLSAKFLAQYKKAAARDCSKLKKFKRAKCVIGKKKALIFLRKVGIQSSVI